ncbi:MAG: 2-oxoacid:acceptor oxidoreductase subunit alpha [Proteobacteria bacterium]|nr:2-oxoacid:acceptor oxidoreductase subunit alpha [Pseudomonadota bacterium]
MEVLGEREQFAQGDVACALGALLGGCDFFAAYPITPATEVAEAVAQMIPKLGGMFVQMEDEIAAISAVIGASWAGSRAMTATSGPGFSLMQENLGYACMTETPCVLVNVQRSGPSTGQPTEPAQGDMLQARWGTHGDHELIVLAPNSVQECLDLTRQAFDLAEEYRTPVLVMTDGEVGHMREKITLPDSVTLKERLAPTTSPEDFVPFKATKGKVPEMASFGNGYHTYVTGLTHLESGLPSTDDAEVHTNLVKRLCEKITDNIDKLTNVEVDLQEGATVGIVSYGISARSASGAVRILREKGIKVNFLRLITVFPFPEKTIQEFATGLDRVVVAELNLGQIYHCVREVVEGRATVELMAKIGGEIITPQEIIDSVETPAG